MTTEKSFWNRDKQKFVRIHLNAGLSRRVVTWIETAWPRTDVNWRTFEDYSYIELANMTENEVDDFIDQLKKMYPMEIETLR